MVSSKEWAEIQQILGYPISTKPVPPQRYQQFARVFPPLLLGLWQTYGFAGFHHGRYWLCDPVEWQPAVDAWTEGLNLAMRPDIWHAIVRTAFGKITLWGERTGCSLSISPVYGRLYPTARSITMMGSDHDRDFQIATAVAGPIVLADMRGSDEKPLFERALQAHGPVGPDTMYTFVPTYHLGGPLSVDHIVIDGAVTHVMLLADLVPHTLMADVTLNPPQ